MKYVVVFLLLILFVTTYAGILISVDDYFECIKKGEI